MAIEAKFAGTCALTGRDYEPGAFLRQGILGGWVIADDETVAAELASALPVTDHSMMQRCHEWEVGSTRKATWIMQGGERAEGIVVITAPGVMTYGSDDEHHCALARIATADEVAAYEAAEVARRAAIPVHPKGMFGWSPPARGK